MNCENFNDHLLEYLDETLSAAEQAAAREHVQNCGACRRALARQEDFAKSIRISFSRETQGLCLRPETKQNILNALKSPELRPTTWENIKVFFASLWRQPAWAGAVLLCFLLMITGGFFCLHPLRHSSSQATANDAQNICVINVPIQTETYVYRKKNNMVVEYIDTGVGVINAGYSENTRTSP